MIGYTPNAMNPAIVKIASVRGMRAATTTSPRSQTMAAIQRDDAPRQAGAHKRFAQQSALGEEAGARVESQRRLFSSVTISAM